MAICVKRLALIAIAYDSINNVFYVGDIENHSIRRIGLENWDDEENPEKNTVVE